MNDLIYNIDPPGDIDPKFLGRLQELGGAKLASELVGMYLTRGGQLLETISANMGTKNFSEVKNAAHSLISSAGNLGGRQVSDLAKQIENAIIDENTELLPELLSQLKSAHAEFHQYLNEALEKL